MSKEKTFASTKPIKHEKLKSDPVESIGVFKKPRSSNKIKDDSIVTDEMIAYLATIIPQDLTPKDRLLESLGIK